MSSDLLLSPSPRAQPCLLTKRGLQRVKTIHILKQEYIQWNLSNPDTNGAEESVIVSEVSSFQRLKCMQECSTWGGKRCPV